LLIDANPKYLLCGEFLWKPKKSAFLTSGPINQTDILAVQVTSVVAEDAHLIADLIADILPEKLFEITGRIPPSVVDHAVTPQAPSAPNTTNNVFIGFLLGVVLACVLIVLYEFINDKIRTSEDITSRYKAPLLAAIPDLADRDKGRKYYYYKHKTKEEAGE
jgi:capsular polysaccharide biosynthesis protein